MLRTAAMTDASGYIEMSTIENPLQFRPNIESMQAPTGDDD